MKLSKNLLLLIVLLFFTACSSEANNSDITQQQLLENTASGKPQLILDVRTAEEFAEGHVPLAVNISVDEVAKEIKQIVDLTDNRTIPVVVYCRSGHRAGIAIEILQQNGFTNISHLEGDMIGWEEAKLDTEK